MGVEEGDLVDGRHGFEQWRQLLLGLYNDSAAQGLDHGQIAAKLQHVAKALLAVHQQPLPAEGRAIPAKAPKRMGIYPFCVFAPEAPFVFFPTLRPLAY
ncbi:MAG: hypothetical protein HZB87_02075 [Desulfatitalea sp.]|nr:hypothetical protein [Desulfatitalea sp.]